HPVFHPIYGAAEETGRPVAIHGGAGGWANPPSTGGGSVSTYFETHVLWPQAIQTPSSASSRTASSRNIHGCESCSSKVDRRGSRASSGDSTPSTRACVARCRG